MKEDNFPIKVKIKKLYGFDIKKNEIHNVFTLNPHPQSSAMLILLKNYYIGVSRDSSTSSGNKPDWRLWLTFRNKFLKKVKRKEKNLTCFFCGLGNLHPNVNSMNAKGIEATVDHFNPTSKGGKKYDEDNLRVCCSNCNQDKKDLSSDQFISILKRRHFKNGTRIHPRWLAN